MEVPRWAGRFPKSREYFVVWYGRVWTFVYYVSQVYGLPTKSWQIQMLAKFMHPQPDCKELGGNSRIWENAISSWNQLKTTRKHYPAPGLGNLAIGRGNPNLVRGTSSQVPCMRLGNPEPRPASREERKFLPHTPSSKKEERCKIAASCYLLLLSFFFGTFPIKGSERTYALRAYLLSS